MTTAPKRNRPKIEVDHEDDGPGHWWRFVAANGQTECFSEIFAGDARASRRGAVRAAKRMAGRIEGGCRVMVRGTDDRWTEA